MVYSQDGKWISRKEEDYVKFSLPETWEVGEIYKARPGPLRTISPSSIFLATKTKTSKKIQSYVVEERSTPPQKRIDIIAKASSDLWGRALALPKICGFREKKNRFTSAEPEWLAS